MMMIYLILMLDGMKSDSGRPLIFKNVSLYSRIYELHRSIPEITFLIFIRDVEQIVRSVVKAYHELGTFNPIPPRIKNKNIRDPVEFAVNQILAIDESIELQK